MNSPYMGNFKVTQQFKGSAHDGLDLVGIDSKDIHATVTGQVVYAGWENPNNHKQGFGQYVCILGENGLYYYYGHLSKILTTTGAYVKCTDTIGIEGDTGYSFGSHCHYCVRPNYSAGCYVDVCEISGIPNELGTYNDGYVPSAKPVETPIVEPAPTTDEPIKNDNAGYGRIVIGDKEYELSITDAKD